MFIVIDNWLERLPEQSHAAAREAVTSTFGAAAIGSIDPVLGGASGALAFRIGVNDRLYLLRMETSRGPLRNPHQYACMRIAADAGIAPPLRYVNDDAGAVIMDFIAARPLSDYPGGPLGLVGALGRLAAELQATAPFPVLGDYRALLGRMLGYIKGLFAPGLLDEHMEGFERIRAAYPWDAAGHVSSHNDPNPRNIIFDGEKLWLIDWETSYRNDALTDVAILVENHAGTPELEESLLTSWSGSVPDRLMRAKLRLMRQLTRLYYAGLLVAFATKPSEPIADLAAPTPDEFRARIASGELRAVAPETRLVLGKMCLAAVVAELRSGSFEEALRVCHGS
ncbi:MAG: phosphotransferase [Acidobacteriota bacterium]